MIVEELVSVLGLEIGAGVFGTLEKFKEAVHGGVTALSVMGGVAAAAFAGIVVSTAEAADEIGHLSDVTGVSANNLQELKYAADQSDVSFETLTNSLGFLAKNAYEASTGSKEAMEAFAGINIRDANGQLKTADQLLYNAVDRFQAIKDPIKQTNLAMKIFGRGGRELLPFLKQGMGAIEGFIDDAHELGYVMSDEVIAAGKDFDEQMKRSKAAILGLRNTLGGPFVQQFANGLKYLANIIRQGQPYMVQLAKTLNNAFDRFGWAVKAIYGVGKALYEVGAQIRTNPLVDALMQLMGAFNGFEVFKTAVIGLGVVLVATGASAAASWILAVAPFVALAVLIGLIVDDIRAFVNGQDSVIGRAQKWAKEFDPKTSPLIQFFKNALSLLFDLGDPAKWNRVAKSAAQAFRYVMTGETPEEHIQSLGGKVIPEGQSPGLKLSEEEAFPDMGHRALRALGIHNNTPVYLPQDFNPSGASLTHLRNFSGGAAGPDAAAAMSSGGGPTSSQPVVNQTNHYSIDASGMDPDQLMSTIKDHEDDRNREALMSVPP